MCNVSPQNAISCLTIESHIFLPTFPPCMGFIRKQSRNAGIWRRDGHCLQAGDPGSRRGRTGTSPHSGGQTRKVGSTQSPFGDLVGRTDQIRTGGNSTEAHLGAWEQCGSNSHAHARTYRSCIMWEVDSGSRESYGDEVHA